MPSRTDIDKVKSNLNNLIDLNSQLLVGGNLKIENAFLLLSMQDNHDLGVQIGINLIDGAFWTAGDVVGGLIANFCCGVISHYSDNTPPSLLGVTSQLITRFQETSNQFQFDLQTFHDSPEEYWDTVYSGIVHTPFGAYPVSGKLSDLATVDVPSVDDPIFTEWLDKCEFGLDQEVWSELLKNFTITTYYPALQFPCKQYSYNDVVNWNTNFYENNPSYWNNFYYCHDKGLFGNDQSYYALYQNNIGTGWSMFSCGGLSEDACNYLFCDLSDGVPNPSAVNGGLFARTFVFNNMSGIKKTTHTFSH